MIDFPNIISPLSEKEFFESYYEKGVFLNHVPEKLNEVITNEHLFKFLHKLDNRYPSVRLVNNGNELDKRLYTSQISIGHHNVKDVINPEKLFELFNNGNTIVIQAAQYCFNSLSAFCKQISEKFNFPIQANIYVTPPNAIGFKPHWDTHDVLVLQIAGEKNWKLFDFEIDLPYRNEPFKNDCKISSTVNKEVELKKGDVLYIPRGYVHSASAQKSISCHVTIGILSYRWRDLFATVLKEGNTVSSLRKSIPFWNGNLDAEIEKIKQELIQNIKDFDFSNEISNLYKKRISNQAQIQNNLHNNNFELTDNAQFKLNTNYAYHLIVKEESVSLIYSGKTIKFPSALKNILEQIINSSAAFSKSDLPSYLDAKGQQTLLKVLVKNHIIILC